MGDRVPDTGTFAVLADPADAVFDIFEPLEARARRRSGYCLYRKT